MGIVELSKAEHGCGRTFTSSECVNGGKRDALEGRDSSTM